MFQPMLLFGMALLGAHAAAGNPAEQALVALEQSWVRALEKGDAAALEAALASTFVDTDEEGHRTGRADLLGALRSGDLKFRSVKLGEMQVRVYGDAAVVTGTAVQDADYKGKPLVARVAFTDTFVKQKGRWRAVASHRSPALSGG